MENPQKERINGADYKRIIINAAETIKENEKEINDLNVFPVPDGDTGSNMSMTIGGAAADLKKLSGEEPIGDTAAKAASSMLRSARGNSGVILSLLFRGIGRALMNSKNEECDGKQWAHALSEGVKSAYQAVDKPAEGTILTVARLSAEKAEAAANENNSVDYVHEAAVREAEEALAETVNQNPVLKKAGVIDAGGKGWLLVLKSMLASLRGKDDAAKKGENRAEPNSDLVPASVFETFDTEDITFTYCTECIIDRRNSDNEDSPTIADLRAKLSEMGDSLVLVDDETTIKIHVHTNSPLTALEYAEAYGDFVNVKIENMRHQHTTKLAENAAPATERAEKSFKNPYGMVAVCSGDGISAIFTELGCDAIISGGQTMNPSTDDILKAVQGVDAKVVFIFPNNKNIILAANQAKELTDRRLEVIPSASVPQGIMAMVQFDGELTPEENTENMTAALDSVDTMEITYAARDSEFDGMVIKKGDYIGMYGRKIIKADQSITPVLEALADEAVKNNKMYLNLYYGSDVSEENATLAAEVMRAKIKGGSIDVTYGGQPLYYYMISAE